MTLPLLGLLAGYTDPSALAPLVVALRTWCRPHAMELGLDAPDAYLAASPAAIGLNAALAGPVPVAVVVDATVNLAELLRDRADVLIVRDPAAAISLGDRAVVFPHDHVLAAAHPSIPPFVRSRWRRRLGLDNSLIVRLGVPDPWPTSAAAIPAALAVCSAAVVRGPWLLTALALGTPVVTDTASARRVHATPDVHVMVAPATDTRSRSEMLAANPARATALGWGGRLLVEERHDLGTVAIEILERLGIGPATFPDAPLASLDAELAALGTPDASPVALRALRRAAEVVGPADWADLTGRRR